MGQVIASGQNLRPDINNAEYIIYNGAYPGHSGKPMQAIGRQAANRVANGDIKISVVDPIMIGGAVTPLYDGIEWVPIKPATDAAFGMGIIRWIIENERYNKEFLSSPNYDAAVSKGYNSWCNAAYLVIEDPDHPNYRKMLRAEDLGIEVGEDEKDIFIVIDENTKEPVRFDETDTADILFNGTVKGANGEEIAVKTAFVKLKESALEYSLEEYSAACNVPVDKIIEMAKEYTSHGTKVSIDGMGNTAAANGSAAVMVHYTLMALVGAYNMKGGVIPRRVSYKSVSTGPRYNISAIPGAPKVTGLRISRTGIRYEDTSEYKNKVARGENPYPSKLPWHPVGGASDSQAIFSIVNKYPYQAKIIFNWMANPLMAVPAAAREEVIEELKKPEVVPLIVSCDCYMGEMTALADYIIPDTTPYESWGCANIEGNFSGKGTTVRWPVVEPATPKLDDGRHICFETYLIDVAKRIGLPGFGDKAISDADGNPLPLNSREDFYLRAIANVAYDIEPVSDISKEEMELQDLESVKTQWADILTEEEWPKVLKVLSRGGRFEEYGVGFDGERHIYPYTGIINIYVERFATSRNSITGQYYSGVPGWRPEAFSDGTLLTEAFPESEWPFKAANRKPKFRSVSMLINSSSLRDICKHNFVEMNTEDAKALGIKTMDKVRVIPATGGEFVGYALVRPGIAKGTIGVAFGYGHWEYGTRKFEIDGQEHGYEDPENGVHLMNLFDPTVKGLFSFSESSTGTANRNGGAFRVEKV